MPGFPAIIPDEEKIALNVRRFTDYVSSALAPKTPPAPQVPPSLPEPAAAPAMPEQGFDPGLQPPQPSPDEQAQQFAAYAAPHLTDNGPQASQGAPEGLPPPEMAPDTAMGPPPTPAPTGPAFGTPEEDRPPSEFTPPSQVAPDAQSQADAFAQYAAGQGASVGGSFAGAQDDRIARAAPPGPFAGLIDRGIYAGGQWLLDRAEEARANERKFEAAAGRIAQDPRAATAADWGRAVDTSIPFTLAMTGEPLEPEAKLATEAAGEVGRLRLDKFPEAVRDTIQAAAEDGNFWQKQRRAVIPDDVAEQMADRLGKSVDQLIGLGRKKGNALNTEQTRAVRNGLVAQAVKVADLAEQVKADPTNGALVANQVAEGMKLADLSRVAEGARAEAGRSLRAYQSFARDFAADPVSAVQRIYRANNLTPEQATAKVAEFQKMVADGADPFAMGRFWANIEKPPPEFWRDWFPLLRYNAMLSGPRTLMVNTIGNAAEIPWRGLRDVGASVAKGRPEELTPEAIGIARGFQRGLGAALETLKHGISAEALARGELPRAVSDRLENGPARTLALGLEAPTRVAQATDDLFREIAYGMASGRQAALRAAQEGLSGRALLDRADELMAAPTAGMMKTAGAIADRMTYHGELGPIAQAATHLQRIPVLGNVMIPFLRTVTHITNRGIDRSPLGLATTAFDVARGAYRNGEVPRGMAPLGERVADNLAGTAGTAALYYLANQGLITGAGPDDPQQRDMLRAQGWRPYSIKVGDTYYGYQQFGPFAVPLSLAAGAAEAQRYAKPGASDGQVALDAFHRTAKLLTDQPYLQGVGAIYKGLTEPDRYGERWLEGTLSTLVPYGSAINTLGQGLDPYERQPAKGDIAGVLATRIPGLRQQQPIKQDVLGRPVAADQSGLGAVVPTRSSRSQPDAALQALLAAGVSVPDPPRTISAGGQNIALTEDDQRLFQRSMGAALSTRVADLTRSDVWAEIPPERQRTQLQRAIEGAQREARADVLDTLSDDELDRRREAARRAKQTRAQPRPGLPLP